MYGTARTTPEGEFSHTVAAEGIAVLDSASEDSLVAPLGPTYQLRYGVSETSDIGFRLGSLSTLGLDFKHNLLKDDFVDLALNPMAQIGYVPGLFAEGQVVSYFHLPFIVDLNLSETTTIVLTPGALYALAEEHDVDIAGPFARLGIGVNVRISRGFAIQPEFTMLQNLGSHSELALLTLASVGFNFGVLPDFAAARD